MATMRSRPSKKDLAEFRNRAATRCAVSRRRRGAPWAGAPPDGPQGRVVDVAVADDDGEGVEHERDGDAEEEADEEGVAVRVAAALQPRPAAEGGEGGVARDGGVDRVPQVQVLALDLLDELAAQEGKVEEERHRGAARGGRVVVGGEGDPALVNGDEELGGC